MSRLELSASLSNIFNQRTYNYITYSNLSDLVCGESGAGHFDHCADLVIDNLATLVKYLSGSSVDYICLMLKLFKRTYKGNHDFGMNIDAFRLAVE